MKYRYVVLQEHKHTEAGTQESEPHFVIVAILEAASREAAVDQVDAAQSAPRGKGDVHYRCIPESQFDPQYTVKRKVQIERTVVGETGKTRAPKAHIPRGNSTPNVANPSQREEAVTRVDNAGAVAPEGTPLEVLA